MENNFTKREMFVSKLRDIFGDKAERVLDAISGPRYETFRINSKKLSIVEVLEKLRELGFEINEGPLPDSYVNVSSLQGLKISQTDFFKNGTVYVQGLSSMLGVRYLDPKSGEKILDICASPGSKTSYIASLTGEPGNISAVENNSSRFFSMKKNLLSQGYSDVVTIKSNAVGLGTKYPRLCGTFDKVLADVPCSNEGNIRFSDKDPFKFWNPKLPKKISMLQKRILASAYNMLKPGGLMVYSTCTYSLEENEAVVNWALKKFSDLDIHVIKTEVKDLVFTRGVTLHKKDKLDRRISGALRILPDKYFDGFFIALFRKQSYLVYPAHK
ncbi:hypothetical protein A2380_01380 [candidate division WWE3 bacterium RIFOXYB1_FULL_43_24]|uniref:Ribosomal RNA small subunit methyltransferase B n=2 Tax=Katanobacteria TaxID=422282 RepID=A0A0G0YSB9_UNCKA|nr:MAG: Ribosomal RNA small subunit methyltransferase B [candidate division WWE3 bacterium GW2011_GWA1_42_12]KKS33825.1 MAG: Ribosomal RNA small subunit methyltransferase B [candidate division WWE3 bacterium GW2011_GWD1_42_14]KKS39509.1 MAG: Ribosomal RNA small subunit methyltransferase B [candidate division WWE3 bacterium GW2011_GWF1_42_14]KKS40952.1 MAG: Ribosomal RNA small subunit methyltransferase B [candidate division WWE3 bacterium GW2011_GWE1_42_16]KKS66790.1 MAG: Ribosomal RNA small sub